MRCICFGLAFFLPGIAAFHGNAIAAADLTADVDPVSFPITEVGQTSLAKWVVITCTGSTGVTVSAVTSTGDFSATVSRAVPFSLSPGETATVNVRFAPTTPFGPPGTLEITSEPPSSPLTVSLSGTGWPVSLGLRGLVNPIDLGEVQLAGSGATTAVHLVSNINQPIVISGMSLGPPGAGWSTSLPSLPTVLPPMGQLPLNVHWQPQAHGLATTGVLHIQSDAPNSPIDVTLGGLGIGPQIAVAPSSLDIGAANVAHTKPSGITVLNTGETTLTLSQVSPTGPNAADFTSLSALPILVPPHTSAQLDIAFTPGGLGARTGELSLVSDDPFQPRLDIPVVGVGTTPIAELIPLALDFGEVNVGVASEPSGIALHNSGTGPLLVTALTLGGAAPSAFRLVAPSLPLLLAPDASEELLVRFSPRSSGTSTATLSVTTDELAGPMHEVALTGSGVTPVMALDPTVLAFGAQIMGRPSSAAVEVRNTGERTLTVSQVTISRGEGIFSLASNELPLSIAPSGAHLVEVRYTPTALRDDEGSLLLASDDIESPMLEVTLTGRGVATLIAVTPDSIDFGDVPVTSEASPKELTVKNLGAAPLVLTEAEISGDAPSSFSVASAKGTLLGGEAKTISVIYAPRTPGAASAIISFAAADGTIPAAHVSVSGSSASDSSASGTSARAGCGGCRAKLGSEGSLAFAILWLSRRVLRRSEATRR